MPKGKSNFKKAAANAEKFFGKTKGSKPKKGGKGFKAAADKVFEGGNPFARENRFEKKRK